MVFALMMPALTFAQAPDDAFRVAEGSFDGTLQAPDTDLRGAIVLVVKYILGFLGILMVIIILYGGYVWMTAGANADRIIKAKKIIINATIGLIIILTSFAIVSLIFRELGRGLGDGGDPCPGCRNDRWRSGIGLGPIESVYPEPNQREVSINTWIAVTFKEPINPATICEGLSEGKCAGGNMKNVEICALGESGGCVVDGEIPVPDNFSKDELAATKVYQTSDGRTFVFYPNKYLGFEDGINRDFYVVLKSGINSKLTNESIFARWGGQQYHWQFTTNGELDLDPPEVLSTNTVLNPRGMTSVSGVFPDPDKLADSYSPGSSPTATTFSFAIAGDSHSKIKSQVTASATPPEASFGSAPATLTGTYGGTQTGGVVVGVNGNTISITSGLGFIESQSYAGGSVIPLGNGLQLNLSSVAESGNSWEFDVTPAQAGDSIELLDGESVIGNYVFGVDIQKGSTISDTLANIKNSLLDNPISSSVFKECTSCVTSGVETLVTGEAGRRYQLRFKPAGDDPTRADLVLFAKGDGTSATETVVIGDKPDVARNAIFQIHFNEAINPLVVEAGAFTVRYGASGGATLDGTAVATAHISNQYRTIELLGTEPCPVENSVNQCGNLITCWPVNGLLEANPNDYAHKSTRFQVSIAAAPLRTCTGDAGTDNWCALWQGTCSAGERCLRTRDMAYYPGVDVTKALLGLIDMSGNSLNGSFDYYINPDRSNKVEGRAQGQSGSATTNGRSGRPAYDLNQSSPWYASSTPNTLGVGSGYGDDFSWSFWLSDKVEVRSPLVSKIEPIGDALLKDFRKPVQVTFDKIMRSSTLRPGWNYGDDQRSRSERYLVFDTITRRANPIGYWITNFGVDVNNDSFSDYTRADILHSQFDPNVTYGPQAGSGLQDVYQNCYLPGVGPADASAVTCQYTDAIGMTTTNCSPSRLPNPASYAYMNCRDVSGAQQCNSGQVCRTTYDSASAGSWIITKDFEQGFDFTTSGASSGGCCLGVCVSE
jgi:hypothetical protein